jgi:hypothetical protein
VDTKLLIVDDEAAFIGSVNANRRSWFHDSEIDAKTVDTTGPGGTAQGTRGWVRNFRADADLWSRHFNVSPSFLRDFATCLAAWQAVITGQFVLLGGSLLDISSIVSVRPYDVGAAVPRFSIAGAPVDSALLELAWNTLEDPT